MVLRFSVLVVAIKAFRRRLMTLHPPADCHDCQFRCRNVRGKRHVRIKSHISDLAARTTARALHAAQHTMVETRARERKRVLAAQAGVAFPGLPNDVAVSLVEKHPRDPADLAVLRAVSKGTRDAVDATGRKVQKFKEGAAVERGCVTTLKCLRRRGRLSDERLLCAAAARSGDLEALKALLRAEKFPWDEKTCACAAEGGHLEVLQWARENDCPWDAKTCARAAFGGHLDILRWARENDCPWDELTCVYAAEGGHLDILKWARENGCPWDESTRRLAAEKGYVEP